MVRDGRTAAMHSAVPSRLRLLLLCAALLLLSASHARAAAAEVAVSYSLRVTPFSGGASTIPASFGPYDPAALEWTNALYDWQLQSYWQRGRPFPDANTFCWSDRAIAVPFAVFGRPPPALVWLSPTGLINLMPAELAHAQPQPLGPHSFYDGLAGPMPDSRLERMGGLISWGFTADMTWDAQPDSIQFAFLHSDKDTDNSTIFLVRGSLQSTANASHPGVFARLEFELQLHEASGAIVLHVARLANATQRFVSNQLAIGVAWSEPRESSGGPDNQASMWLQRQFAPGDEVSATLIWTPYENARACVGARDCGECTAQADQCLWCAATSSCVRVEPDADPAIATSSAHCPSGVLSDQCPPELFTNCARCTAQGHRWCTGEGDCSLAPLASNASSPYPQSACNPYDFYSSRFETTIGRCIGADDLCGSSCNAFHRSTHMVCGSGSSSRSSSGSGGRVQCQCEHGYLFLDSLQPGQANCQTCDTELSFQDYPGHCALCPSLTPGLVAGLLAATALITFLLVKLNSNPLIQRLLVPIQNSIVYFQVLSLLSLIDFHWPAKVRTTIDAVTIAGLNLANLPSVGCFMTFRQGFIFSILLPPTVACMLVLAWFGARLVNWGRQRCGTLSASAAKDSAVRWRLLFVRSFLSLALLHYNSATHMCLGIFLRIDMWAAFVARDAEDGPAERQWFALAVIATAVHVAGTPILFLALLRPRSSNRCVGERLQCGCFCRAHKEHAEALRPLTRNFRPGVSRYWEGLVTPLWKLLLNAVIIFGTRSQQVGLIAALLVALVAAFAYWQPYAAGINNRQQQWLLSGSLVILAAGLLFWAAAPGDTKAKKVLLIFSYCVVAATLFAMCALIIGVLVVVVRAYRREQREKAQAEAAAGGTAEGGVAVQLHQRSSRDLGATAAAHPIGDRDAGADAFDDLDDDDATRTDRGGAAADGDFDNDSDDDDDGVSLSRSYNRFPRSHALAIDAHELVLQRLAPQSSASLLTQGLLTGSVDSNASDDMDHTPRTHMHMAPIATLGSSAIRM